MEELYQRFKYETQVYSAENAGEPELLVVATRLPTGAVETQINTSNIIEKINYIKETYDDEFKMKRNPLIQIVGFLIV